MIKNKSDDVLIELPSVAALSQKANRARKKGKDIVKEPKYLKDLIINENFKKTYKGEEFLLGESGADNERIFLFSTPKNMKLLSKNTSWMSDGTFAVLPVIFLQLYTILVIENNFPLPLAFGLLPNKKMKTYESFFKLISDRITCMPKSFNVDFELATFGAIRKVFGNEIQIYGCYFHLSQSFFRNIQLQGFINDFRNNKLFKKCFQLCQALAFLPVEDVKLGYILLKTYVENNCETFSPFLQYIETYYIGSIGKKARFEIKTWNVHHRILMGLPRTSNKLERFNKEFNSDSGDFDNATHDIIDHLRLEQANTELLLLKIKMGDENPKNKLQQDLYNALKNVLDKYDKSDKFSFLNSIVLTLQHHNKIINKSKGKKQIATSTDEEDSN